MNGHCSQLTAPVLLVYLPFSVDFVLLSPLPAGALCSWSELAGSWGWRRLLFSAVSFWPEGAVTLQTLEEGPRGLWDTAPEQGG